MIQLTISPYTLLRTDTDTDDADLCDHSEAVNNLCIFFLRSCCFGSCSWYARLGNNNNNNNNSQGHHVLTRAGSLNDGGVVLVSDAPTISLIIRAVQFCTFLPSAFLPKILNLGPNLRREAASRQKSMIS